MLNTIYVISNLHLNYQLAIRPSGHSPQQKIPPLCEVVGFDPWDPQKYAPFVLKIH